MADPSKGFGDTAPSYMPPGYLEQQLRPSPETAPATAPAQVQTQAQPASTPSPIGNTGGFGGTAPSYMPPGYLEQQPGYQAPQQAPVALPEGVDPTIFDIDTYQAEEAKADKVLADIESGTVKFWEASNEDWNQIGRSVVRAFYVGEFVDLTDEQQSVLDGFVEETTRKYGDYLESHIENAAEGWWDKNYVAPEGQPLWKDVLGTATGIFSSTAGTVLKAPLIKQLFEGMYEESQLSLKGVNLARVGFNEGSKALLDIGGEDENSWLSKHFENQPGLFAAGADGDTSFLEAALGLEAEWGGKWGKVVDFVGRIAVDPITYVSFGQSSGAKIWIEAMELGAAKAGLPNTGSRFAAIISAKGINGLTATERLLAGKWSTDAFATAMGAVKDPAKAMARGLKAVEKGGRKGVRLGGRTVLPTEPIMSRVNSLSKIVTGKPLTARLRTTVDDVADDAARVHNPASAAQAARGVAIHDGASAASDDMFNVLNDIDDSVAGSAGRVSDDLASGADDLELFEAYTDADFFQGLDDTVDPSLSLGAAAREADDAAGLIIKSESHVSKVMHDLEEILPGISDDALLEIEEGLLTGLRTSRLVTGTRKTFVPRSGLDDARLATLNSSARIVDRTVNLAGGARDSRVFDATKSLSSRLGRRAAREVEGGKEGLNTLLTKAMSTSDDYALAVAKLTADGTESVNTLRLLTSLERNRSMGTSAGRVAGQSADQLREAQNYIPRIIAPNIKKTVRKAWKQIEGKANKEGFIEHMWDNFGIEIHPVTGRIVNQTKDAKRSISSMADQAGHTQKRTYEPELQDLAALSKKTADSMEAFGIKNFGDIYQNDVIAAVASRSNVAFEGAMFMEVTDELATYTDEFGRMFAYSAVNKSDVPAMLARMSADGIEGQRGFVQTILPGGGQTYINQGIHDELSAVRRLLTSTEDMSVLKNNMNGFNAVWAAGATVFVPVNTAFTLRNAVGNVFLTTMADMRDPRLFAVNANLQRITTRASQHIKKVGGTWDEAMEHFNVSTLNKERLRLIHQEGIYGTSRAGDLLSGAGSQGRLAKGIIENPIIEYGRKLNTMAENNARGALFLDGLNKGMSPGSASARVRKYLFDYSDLTKFENDYLRTMNRFYTFMRKNTAIQVATLIHYPGRVVNAQRIVDAGADVLMGEEVAPPDGFITPDWAAARNMRLRQGGWFGPDTPNLVGVDSPLLAATKSLTELGAPLALLPGAEHILPTWLTYGDDQDIFGRIMGNFAGFPAAVVDYFEGGNLNRDPFTGGPLEDGEWASNLRLANTFFPGAGKAWSTFEKLALHDTPEGMQLALINIGTGLSTYDVTEDRNGSALRAIRNEAQNLLTDIKQDFPEIADNFPSWQELLDEGLVSMQQTLLELNMYTDPEDLSNAYLDNIPADALRVLQEEFPNIFIRPDPLENPDDPVERALSNDAIVAQVRLYLADAGAELPLSTEMNIRSIFPNAATKEWLVAHGIEPDSAGNIHIPTSNGVGEAENLARWNAQFGGKLTPAEYAEINPLLTKMERSYRDAQAIGMTDDLFREWIITESLNRTEMGNLPDPIFGTSPDAQFSLDRFRDGSATEEDIAKFRVRSWEQRSEVIFVYEMFYGRPPTQVEITDYIYKTLMTKTLQEAIGLPEGEVIPSRQNIQTDDEIRDTALSLYDIVEGVSGMPASSGGVGGSPSSFGEVVANRGGTSPTPSPIGNTGGFGGTAPSYMPPGYLEQQQQPGG